jgi:hypothetical protein
MHRGTSFTGPVRAPLNGATDEDYARPESQVTFFSFVGPMVRTEVVRRIGVPPREMFIRFEDLEYSARIAREGAMWLINDSVMVHKETVPLLGMTPKDMLSNFMLKGEFPHLWKGVYGLRNIIDGGRRIGYVSGFARSRTPCWPSAARCSSTRPRPSRRTSSPLRLRRLARQVSQRPAEQVGCTPGAEGWRGHARVPRARGGCATTARSRCPRSASGPRPARPSRRSHLSAAVSAGRLMDLFAGHPEVSGPKRS